MSERRPAEKNLAVHPVRLVLDLDAGIDDALALAYALGSSEVELVAVVASYGNVTQERAARNACALLDLLGRPDVPVYAGADRPLGAAESFSPAAGVVRIHGESGLGASELPAPSRPTRADGVGWLAREGCAAPPAAPLTYVPTGPLTNLALALRARPEPADVCPHGAAHQPGACASRSPRARRAPATRHLHGRGAWRAGKRDALCGGQRPQ